MRTTQVMSIIFRKKESSYEFLLLKRIKEKGGFWQPPTGGLEDSDESKLHTAFREILEETTIKKEEIKKVIEDVHSFTIDKHYLTSEPINPRTEYVYGFEVGDSAKISVHHNIYPEHEEFKWVSFEEALEMLKWDNNKEALTKLNSIIS
jgi:dihydroneopterin triphosphate diphosphatase